MKTMIRRLLDWIHYHILPIIKTDGFGEIPEETWDQIIVLHEGSDSDD